MSQKQFYLFKTRRFLPLFLTQFLGAFNDNIFKNAMVVLIAWRLASAAGMNAQIMVTVAAGVLSLPFEATGILICILLATFVLGFFLDWIELTLIILPLVSPVVTGLGFDPVWFTILFAVCLQTSFLTPPVGFAIFYLKGVAPEGVDVRTIYRGVVPFIVLQLIGLLIIFNWKALVTWLPAQAYS